MPLIAASGNNNSHPQPANHPDVFYRKTGTLQHAPQASPPAKKLPPVTPTPTNSPLMPDINDHNQSPI
jgi:hypothetical protein